MFPSTINDTNTKNTATRGIKPNEPESGLADLEYLIGTNAKKQTMNVTPCKKSDCTNVTIFLGVEDVSELARNSKEQPIAGGR